MTSIWTHERVRLLGERWSARCTAAAIAVELGGGISRSAVIGKANRLGLKQGVPLADACTAPAPSAPAVPVALAAAPLATPDASVTSERQPRGAGPAHAGLDADLPPGRRHCRWPTGEGDAFRFCCEPATRATLRKGPPTYCETHYARSVGKGTPSERGALRGIPVNA